MRQTDVQRSSSSSSVVNIKLPQISEQVSTSIWEQSCSLAGGVGLEQTGHQLNETSGPPLISPTSPRPWGEENSTYLCGPPAANPGPVDCVLRRGLGYLKHHWTDNAHFTIWSFPPQPQMPETLFQREEKNPYISRPYGTGSWLSLWSWNRLQVRSAGFQMTVEEADSADRRSIQCPTPWQREQIPIYLLSYMSSQACCCAPVLPGSTSILAVGLQQHASLNAMKVILSSGTRNPNTILFDKASH